MANQIQATVYQIDGNPLPSPIVISFLTSDILMRRNAISTIPEVSSSITYYPNTSNQLQEQTFFVSEDLRVLRDAANTNGTTQVPTIILEIDGDPLVSAINFLFPANGVSIWPSVNAATGVNSFIEFKNKRYSAAETEAELTAQANASTAPYKVYTALLTQSGGDNPDSTYSGDLVIGRTYQIFDLGGAAGYDFTNVGAPNNNIDTWFVATGVTPNSWGTNVCLNNNSGAPVVTVLENTIGNIWFIYGVKGLYYINSDAGWNRDKLWYGVSGLGDSGANNINPGRVTMSIEGPNPDMLILCYNNDYSSLVDQQLNNTPIEIRVYN